MAAETLGVNIPAEAPASQSVDPTATDLCVWNLVDRSQINLLASLNGNRRQLLEHFKAIALDLDTPGAHAMRVDRESALGRIGRGDVSEKFNYKQQGEGLNTEHTHDLTKGHNLKSHLEREYQKRVDQSDNDQFAERVRKLDSHATNFSAHYLLDWHQYALSRTFSAAQTSAILEIAYKSHAHFVAASPVSTPRDAVEFFTRLMLLHSVADLPRSMRVFSAVQCCDAVEYFVRDYVKAAPLVRFLHFPREPLLDCPVLSVEEN